MYRVKTKQRNSVNRKTNNKKIVRSMSTGSLDSGSSVFFYRGNPMFGVKTNLGNGVYSYKNDVVLNYLKSNIVQFDSFISADSFLIANLNLVNENSKDYNTFILHNKYNIKSPIITFKVDLLPNLIHFPKYSKVNQQHWTNTRTTYIPGILNGNNIELRHNDIFTAYGMHASYLKRTYAVNRPNQPAILIVIFETFDSK